MSAVDWPSLPTRLLSGDLLTKLIRFACVGVASGAIYAAVTALLVRGIAVPPVPASILGYCASVPLSFLGHRGFSFRSNGHWTHEALRFVVAQALNMAVTAGSMQAAVVGLGLSYVWGMVAAVVFVPGANFLLMNLWVFRDQGGRPNARATP
ncbi:MAG: GtrA family protein [Novosphingobium sp.]